jgi:hypothetical protein
MQIEVLVCEVKERESLDALSDDVALVGVVTDEVC